MTPGLYRLAAELLVALAVMVGLFAAGHHGGVKAGRAEVQQRWDVSARQQAEAATTATAAARTEEQRRTAAAQEIADEAENAASTARADAVAAGAAADRLRARAAQLAARCGAAPGDPAAAAGSAPGAAPGLVLADMLGRADDTAGELAAALDRAHIAGRACERAYDSLTAR